MKKLYALEWIDRLINSDILQVVEQLGGVQTVIDRIYKEKVDIQVDIFGQVFSLTEPKHIEVLLHHYHMAIVGIMNKAYHLLVLDNSGLEDLSTVYHTVLTSLNDLLTFMDVRLGEYVRVDRQIPQISISDDIRQIREKLDGARLQLVKVYKEPELAQLVVQETEAFLERITERRGPSVREVAYFKNLLDEIMHPDNLIALGSGFSALEELLISFNFNVKAYSKWCLKSLNERLADLTDYAARLEMLEVMRRGLNMIFIPADRALYGGNPDLSESISNWLMYETAYNKRMMKYQEMKGVLPQVASGPLSSQEKNKLKLSLTGDQIAIIFRAAYELGILMIRSLSAVFKRLIPWIATEDRDLLEWDSTRRRAYEPEQTDKEAVINALNAMIEKVMEY